MVRFQSTCPQAATNSARGAMAWRSSLLPLRLWQGSSSIWGALQCLQRKRAHRDRGRWEIAGAWRGLLQHESKSYVTSLNNGMRGEWQHLGAPGSSGRRWPDERDFGIDGGVPEVCDSRFRRARDGDAFDPSRIDADEVGAASDVGVARFL